MYIYTAVILLVLSRGYCAQDLCCIACNHSSFDIFFAPPRLFRCHPSTKHDKCCTQSLCDVYIKVESDWLALYSASWINPIRCLYQTLRWVVRVWLRQTRYTQVTSLAFGLIGFMLHCTCWQVCMIGKLIFKEWCVNTSSWCMPIKEFLFWWLPQLFLLYWTATDI